MKLLPALLPCLLAACTPRSVPYDDTLGDPGPTASDDLTRTSVGQRIAVGGPKVTPLQVLEDSRCPVDARCVLAGQVRIRVRINLGSGSQTRELTQGTPVPIADGTLELVEVQPDRVTQRAFAPGEYRFGFRFMGGL